MSTPKKKSSKKSTASEGKASKKSSANSEKPIEKSVEAPAGEMTAEKYVDVTLQLLPKVMEVLIHKMEGLSKKMETVSEENADNPFGALGDIMGVFIEAISEFEADFKAMGTSSEVINSWEDNHKEELEEYFTKNPKAQEQIDALKKRLEGLMSGGFEAEKGNEEPAEEQGLPIEKAANIMITVMQKSADIVAKQWATKSKKIDPKDKQRELGKLMDAVQKSSELEAIYKEFGITANEFDTFMKDKGYKVQDYIEEHPDLKKKLDATKAKYEKLAQ
jgi:hypothetical protein